MQQEIAKVSYIDGEYVFLKTSANNTSCGECSSKASCGSMKLFKPIVDNDVIKIKNTLGLKEGDSVMLVLPPSKLLFGTFLVYFLPLVSLMLFSIAGKIFVGEGASIIAGLVGLGLSLYLVKRLLARNALTQQFTPSMEPEILGKV